MMLLKNCIDKLVAKVNSIDTSAFVLKTMCDTDKSELENKILVVKTNFDNTISSLDSKIAVNKTKNISIENELKKLKTFDLSYFRGNGHFDEDGTQHYLVFQPINRYIKLKANNKLYISSWKSKGLSDKTIKHPVTSNNSLTPFIDYVGDKIRLKFNESCLKQPKLQYTHGTIVNIYILYELGASRSTNSNPTI